MQFQVADLPPGRDPADVWRDDPEALVSAVKGATPFLEFRIERLLASSDLSSLEGRAHAGERAAAMIVEHPNDLVRDQYVMRLAGQLDIAPDRLRDAVATALARPHAEAGRSRATRDCRGRRRSTRARRAAMGGAGAGADERSSARRTCSPIRSRAARSTRSRAGRGTNVSSRPRPRSRRCLQRLAVEEPEDGVAADERVVRVVVNLVEASSRRVHASMLRDDDPRASEVEVAARRAREREIRRALERGRTCGRAIGNVDHRVGAARIPW